MENKMENKNIGGIADVATAAASTSGTTNKDKRVKNPTLVGNVKKLFEKSPFEKKLIEFFKKAERKICSVTKKMAKRTANMVVIAPNCSSFESGASGKATCSVWSMRFYS